MCSVEQQKKKQFTWVLVSLSSSTHSALFAYAKSEIEKKL